jgi:6-phosphogluconate dehydrogenase
VDLSHCIRVWRAGCIIRSGAISDLFLKHLSSSSPINLLLVPEIAKVISETYADLKETVHYSLHADAVVPALSASLEWVKSCGGKDLPTNFEEMQLDTFGAHRYDNKGEEIEGTKKGPYQ